MTQSIVDQIRSLFKHIAREPLLGERKLGVPVGISHSTAGKYKKKAKELGLLPEVIGNMSDEEIISLFNIRLSTRQEFIQPDWEEIRIYLQTKGHWGRCSPL